MMRSKLWVSCHPCSCMHMRNRSESQTAASFLLVADAYKTCKETLIKNRDLVEDLVELLIEKETVDYKELADLVVKYHPEMKEDLEKKAPPQLTTKA